MPLSRIIGGAAAGGIVTAPLMAVFYLANQLLELPFPPYDLFDWITRVLPGPVVTFGLDLFIDGMILVGLNVADTAKTAELAVAQLQFFGIGVAVGTALAVVAPPLEWDLRKAGTAVGGISGLTMAFVSIAIGGSSLPEFVSLVWITARVCGVGIRAWRSRAGADSPCCCGTACPGGDGHARYSDGATGARGRDCGPGERY